MIKRLRGNLLCIGSSPHGSAWLAAILGAALVVMLVAPQARALDFRYHGTITRCDLPCGGPLFDVGSEWSIFLDEFGSMTVTLGAYSYLSTGTPHLLLRSPGQGPDLFLIEGFGGLFGTEPVNGTLPDTGDLTFSDSTGTVFGDAPVVLLEPPDPQDFDSVTLGILFQGIGGGFGFIVSSDNAALPEPDALELLLASGLLLLLPRLRARFPTGLLVLLTVGAPAAKAALCDNPTTAPVVPCGQMPGCTTVALVGDTQGWVDGAVGGSWPLTFQYQSDADQYNAFIAMMDWLLANRGPSQENISFVVHVGDIKSSRRGNTSRFTPPAGTSAKPRRPAKSSWSGRAPCFAARKGPARSKLGATAMNASRLVRFRRNGHGSIPSGSGSTT